MNNAKQHRILIVDDDPVMVKLLDKLLQSAGYKVLVSDEAPRGLEVAMKQTPELIVLDVMMPIINGFNICRLLKSQATHKHIPIILLTSRVTEEDRRIGCEVGADAYMVKPLNTEEFLAKVKELLKI